MNVIESILSADDNGATVRLQCGHVLAVGPYARPGQCIPCPECHWTTIRSPATCTAEQLEAVAADYIETMRARGFVIGEPEKVAILRAAGIQDAWRVAFARALK